MMLEPKHELHPDAESLSAFADEALGAQERGEIVAHLAQCGRCRDIVFLAQEAASQMEMEMAPQLAIAAAAPAPRLNSSLRKKRWFKSWRLAWVPAGVLAFVVTIAFIVHLRRGEVNSDVAKVEPAPADHSAAAAPPAQPQSESQAAPLVVQPPAAGKARETEEKKMIPQEPELALKARSMGAESHEGIEHRQMTSIGGLGEATPAAPPPTAQGATADIVATQAMADAQVEQKQSEIILQTERSLPLAQSRAKASGAVPKEMHGSALAGAAAPRKTMANAEPSAGSMASRGRLTAGVFGELRSKAISLPSGLGAVSIASLGRRTVAIDAAGSVFVSDESDGHWDPVTKQWSGRAATIRLQTGAGANAEGKTPAAAGFEMVNDQGQFWVSTNGRIWIAK